LADRLGFSGVLSENPFMLIFQIQHTDGCLDWGTDEERDYRAIRLDEMDVVFDPRILESDIRYRANNSVNSHQGRRTL